jgi:hypothetical protein
MCKICSSKAAGPAIIEESGVIDPEHSEHEIKFSSNLLVLPCFNFVPRSPASGLHNVMQTGIEAMSVGGTLDIAALARLLMEGNTAVI